MAETELEELRITLKVVSFVVILLHDIFSQ
jgi:hypothetical protein